ncbi:MAG: hypothetical protein ACTSPL_07275 [Candidatus Odinarchaeia archaeon]
MTASFISKGVKRAGDLLKRGATDQILEYESKLNFVKDVYKDLLSKFIVCNFNLKEAYETALNFFGSDEVKFAGIDGTVYSKEVFDLVIFFGGACASTGIIKFKENDHPKVCFSKNLLKDSLSISSVVPIYISEIPEVDQTFFSEEEPGELSLSKPLMDRDVIDNSTIGNWIMTFAEYFLAYKLASSEEFKVILMDRTISGEMSSLIYDTSKRELWPAKSALLGLEVDGKLIDMNDLSYARYGLRNLKLNIPPPRGDYLRYALINLIKQEGPLTLDEICKLLNTTEESRVKRITTYLEKSVKEGFLLKNGEKYEVNPEYNDSWDRIKKLVNLIGERFFAEHSDTVNNPMKIAKEEGEQWLTTLDLAFLTLFSLQMLIETCWSKKILLLGITKDTSARDFKRQLIPVLMREGLIKTTLDPKVLEKLPNTDRMILQAASLLNFKEIEVPWSLIEYDAAFKTIVPDREGRVGYVNGAIKNRISLEKTFLKTYIQLSKALSNPMLRSNVLYMDRLVYPEFDLTSETLIGFKSEYGGAVEPVEVVLYKDNTVKNPVQNLIMNILSAMSDPSVPEAFGHNKALFAADKVVKWYYNQFKQVGDTIAHWIMNNNKLRKFMFYMGSFRERRAGFEATRRRRA